MAMFLTISHIHLCCLSMFFRGGQGIATKGLPQYPAGVAGFIFFLPLWCLWALFLA